MPVTTRAITRRPPPVPRSAVVNTIAIAKRSVFRALSDTGGASDPAIRRRALLVIDVKSRPTIGSRRRFPTCANPRTVRKRATCSTPDFRLSLAGTRDPTSVRPGEYSSAEEQVVGDVEESGEPFTRRWVHVEDIGKVWPTETSDRRPEDEET